MLQIDHVYEFLYQELFKDFEFWHLFNGVPSSAPVTIHDISIFTSKINTTKKILFYDQEPFINSLSDPYINLFNWQAKYTLEEHRIINENNLLPAGIGKPLNAKDLEFYLANPEIIFKTPVLVSSEISPDINKCVSNNNLYSLYYFFHGFAALDWYRGFYALNYSKPVIKNYAYDYVSYNRIINNDRSYRIYWVSRLAELGLFDHGQVSFNVTDNPFDDWRDEVVDPNTKLSEHARQHAEQHLTDINKLVIDRTELPGSASADISRSVDALWNVVTETVFYYDKLHLTEKIFKPIVSKQPFMLIAAPGNLEYLRSYGFKTFDGIIDESYDLIQDNDQRIDAVVKQLRWYCSLSQEEKSRVIERLAPVVDYNFHHFYGAFRHIITKELLNNCKTLFKEIGYDDSTIAYENIYRVLTT